jgi:CTP synthase (UTP-ammonia lyase)
MEALQHAGYELGTKIKIKWIDSETLKPGNYEKLLSDCAGIIIRVVSAIAESKGDLGGSLCPRK